MVPAPIMLAAAAALLAVSVPPVHAQAPSDIGSAFAVENRVDGSISGRNRVIAQGDRVFQDERISTQADSMARLVFVDETDLRVGPSSSVVLDRFVHDGGGRASAVTINAAKGALRFISGASPSQAYRIRTPLATIGVRGTVVDTLVEAGRVLVAQMRGFSQVCTGGGVCADLSPGEFVVITRAGISPPAPIGAGTWTFERYCVSGGSICAPLLGPSSVYTPPDTRAGDGRGDDQGDSHGHSGNDSGNGGASSEGAGSGPGTGDAGAGTGTGAGTGDAGMGTGTGTGDAGTGTGTGTGDTGTGAGTAGPGVGDADTPGSAGDLGADGDVGVGGAGTGSAGASAGAGTGSAGASAGGGASPGN
jgi:hypothetical protein